MPERLQSDSNVRYVEGEDAAEVLDNAARHYLGITGPEFLKQLAAGKYSSEEHCSDPRIVYLTMLLPFGEEK